MIDELIEKEKQKVLLRIEQTEQLLKKKEQLENRIKELETKISELQSGIEGFYKEYPIPFITKKFNFLQKIIFKKEYENYMAELTKYKEDVEKSKQEKQKIETEIEQYKELLKQLGEELDNIEFQLNNLDKERDIKILEILQRQYKAAAILFLFKTYPELRANSNLITEVIEYNSAFINLDDLLKNYKWIMIEDRVWRNEMHHRKNFIVYDQIAKEVLMKREGLSEDEADKIINESTFEELEEKIQYKEAIICVTKILGEEYCDFFDEKTIHKFLDDIFNRRKVYIASSDFLYKVHSRCRKGYKEEKIYETIIIKIINTIYSEWLKDNVEIKQDEDIQLIEWSKAKRILEYIMPILHSFGLSEPIPMMISSAFIIKKEPRNPEGGQDHVLAWGIDPKDKKHSEHSH